MKNYKLGIIGSGNMAQAILKGIMSEKMSDYKLSVILTKRSQSNKIDKLGYKNLLITDDTKLLVEESDYILLAVKPQVFKEAVKDLDLKDKIIISVMAGISTDKIREITGAKKIIRVMPNLNANIGLSLNSYLTKGLNEPEETFICALLSSFGVNVKVVKEDFSVATGIAGSGPAFVFMFIKAFVETALKYGFSKEESVKMSTQMIASSALQVGFLADEIDFEQLIGSVCSKGGTTIEGVNYLKEHDFCNIVSGAIEQSIKRAEELEQL